VNALEKLIVVGDRVLVKPKSLSEKTQSGLFLPPGVQEREKIQSGYILKVGPGYPIPLPIEAEESWKKEEKIRYVPLQAKEGDLAIYLQNGAIEITYDEEKYFIVPQNSILLLVRDEDLFV
jgi:chaperonin GroES